MKDKFMNGLYERIIFPHTNKSKERLKFQSEKVFQKYADF